MGGVVEELGERRLGQEESGQGESKADLGRGRGKEQAGVGGTGGYWDRVRKSRGSPRGKMYHHEQELPTPHPKGAVCIKED